MEGIRNNTSTREINVTFENKESALLVAEIIKKEYAPDYDIFIEEIARKVIYV